MVKGKPSKEQQVPVSDNLHCQDCQIAYDYHSKDCKGEYILCRCPYFEFSRFLRHDRCDKLLPKKKL